MTREEFEQYAKENGLVVWSKEQSERAIKALEQEPCDCISREAVLKLFATHDGKYLYEAIRDMPSAEQEPKTDSDCISREQAIKCLECDFDITGRANMEVVVNYINSAHDKIMNLPSVKQEPKTDILDKIKKEIYEQKNCVALDDDSFCLFWYISGLLDAIEIIDKYRQEG